MNLLQSWSTSIAFFLPHNFKSLCIDSVSLMKQAFIAWFKKLGWLLISVYIIWLASHIISPLKQVLALFDDIIETNIFFNSIRPYVQLSILPIIAFTLILAVGLSARKGKTIKISGLITWIIIAIAILLFIGVVLELFFRKYYHITGQFGGVIYMSFLAPWVLFSFFFLLDSKGTSLSAAYSFWQSFKMTLFNYPFCLLVSFLFFGILHLIYSLDQYLRIGYLTYPLLLIFAVLFPLTSLMGSFYIKRREDCPEFY